MASLGERVARGVVGCFGLVVGLVVALYLVVNLVSVVKAERERGRLEGVATERLRTALPEATATLDDAQATIGRDPDTTWVEQSCQFDTDDGGWIVQNYREVCRVTAVAVWNVDDEANARSLAGSLAAPADDSNRAGEPCVAIGRGAPRVTFVPAGTDLEAQGWCAGLIASSNGRRVLVGAPPERSAATGRLIVVTTAPLLDEAIGCTHWSVLFCGNPFGDEHAFGEPPRA